MTVKILVMVSIWATVFATINISLSALGMRDLLPAAMSLYFQVLAVVGLQAYLVKYSNFDVYKEDPGGSGGDGAYSSITGP